MNQKPTMKFSSKKHTFSLACLFAIALVLYGCCNGKTNDENYHIADFYKEWIMSNENLTCIYKEMGTDVLDTVRYSQAESDTKCERKNNGNWMHSCYVTSCSERDIIQNIAIQPAKMTYYVSEVHVEINNYHLYINNNYSYEQYTNGNGQGQQKTINGTLQNGILFSIPQKSMEIFVVRPRGVMEYKYKDSTGTEHVWQRIN